MQQYLQQYVIAGILEDIQQMLETGMAWLQM